MNKSLRDNALDFLTEAPREEIASIFEELDEDALGVFIAAIPFEIKEKVNLRLAAAVAEHMSVDESQALYRFVVKVTKLY